MSAQTLRVAIRIVPALAVLVLAATAGAAAPERVPEAPQEPAAGRTEPLRPPLAPFLDAPAQGGSSTSLESKSGYNTDYLFAMTRGVADSTLTPALKPLVFIVTIPLDIVTLPFALIGGLIA